MRPFLNQTFFKWFSSKKKIKNEWNTLSDRSWETTAAPEKTTTAAGEQAENFIVMATYDKQSTILNNDEIKIWIIILH